MRKLALIVPLLLMLAVPALAPPGASAAERRPSLDVAIAAPLAVAPATCGVELPPVDLVSVVTTNYHAPTLVELATVNRRALAPRNQRLRARGPSLTRREQVDQRSLIAKRSKTSRTSTPPALSA